MLRNDITATSAFYSFLFDDDNAADMDHWSMALEM
jgi:hypothetical protein